LKLPDKEEAMEAIETIVRYIEQCGSDLREGLENTPERVVQSYEEIFSGYSDDASEILDSTFNAEGYDGIVLLRDMEFHRPKRIIFNHFLVRAISLTSSG
jgi:GTP cyclohydrolase I